MTEKIHLISQSSSSPNLLNNEKDYNSFTHLVKRKMENYCVEKDSNLTDFERTKKLLHYSKIKINREEKELINKISRNKINIKKNISHYNYSTNNSKVNSSDNLFNTSKKSIMSVSIPKDTFYFSPLHSLNVLKINSVIHSDVIKTNINRQKLLYRDSIKNSENIKTHILTKMPKIRISRITPKFINIPIINRINNTANKDEEKNIKDNKEKENEKSHTNKSSNKINHKNNIKFNNPMDYNRFFCYYKYPIINFPESREQFALVLSGNLLFLIGGMCCDNSLGELWLCNLINISWNKINSPIDTFVKFGHIAVLDKFNSKIFVYGGRAKYDMHITYGKNKYIYCDLEYFDIRLNKWIKPEIMNKNLVPQRRNHIGELIGNQLLIMGGIDEEDNILNDAYYINLSVIENGKGRWHELSISPNTPGPYLFGHSSSFVFQNDLLKDSKLSVYQYPEEINEDKIGGNNRKRNKIKGIYIFGGKSKYDGIGGLSNDMYVLILGKKPCLWIRLDNVKGVKPKPRYFHSMSYYEPGGFLIIHGGRNDYHNESFALDDTFIFNLNYLQWHKIHLYSTMIGFKIFPRCGHKSIIYSNKLIIFGGMNNLNYLGSSLFVINLSEDYSPEFKTAEEIILENLTKSKNDSSNQKGKEQNKVIQELRDKINKNHKLGFVDNVNLPWIK